MAFFDTRNGGEMLPPWNNGNMRQNLLSGGFSRGQSLPQGGGYDSSGINPGGIFGGAVYTPQRPPIGRLADAFHGGYQPHGWQPPQRSRMQQSHVFTLPMNALTGWR